MLFFMLSYFTVLELQVTCDPVKETHIGIKKRNTWVHT
jgi:hypothetical protein